jgi:hypothetical protein
MTQRLPLPLTPAMLARANENEPKPRYTAEGVAEDWHGGQFGNEQDQAEPMQAVANSHSANVEDDYDPQHQEEKGEDMVPPLTLLSDLGKDYGFYGGQPYRDGDIGPRDPYPSAEVLDEPAGVAAFDTRRVPLPLTGAMLAKANANEPKPRYDIPADWSQGASGNDIDIATLTTPVVTRASTDTVTPYPIRTQTAKGAAMNPALPILGDLGRDYGVHTGETGRTGTIEPGTPYSASPAADWPSALNRPVWTSGTNTLAWSGPLGGGATGTSVPQSRVLTDRATQLNSSGAGQVIEGLNITAAVRIRHNNVVLKQCRISAPELVLVQADSGAPTGVVIEDCLIDGTNIQGPTGYNPDAGGGGSIIRRCNIMGCENGIMIGENNQSIFDCWIHDLFTGGTAHTDGIQGTGGYTALTIRGCAIYSTDTSCIIQQNEGGGFSGLVIDSNYLVINAGSACIVCRGDKTAGVVGAVTITNNKMQKIASGAYTDIQSVTGPVTFIGNTDAITGAPIAQGQ